MAQRRKHTRRTWNQLDKRKILKTLEKMENLDPAEMLPDLGTFLLQEGHKGYCEMPFNAVLVISPAGDETDLIFRSLIERKIYLGTLIVSRKHEEVRAEIMENRYIKVIARASLKDRHTSAAGEDVIPLRGVYEIIPHEEIFYMSKG